MYVVVLTCFLSEIYLFLKKCLQFNFNWVVTKQLLFSVVDYIRKLDGLKRHGKNVIFAIESSIQSCNSCFFASILDDVFGEGGPPSPFLLSHKRSNSTTTTVSEREFKQELNKYNSIRKCFVKRHDSQQEYQRFSARYYGKLLCVLNIC